jgi:acyl-CoA thioester hydrolase
MPQTLSPDVWRPLDACAGATYNQPVQKELVQMDVTPGYYSTRFAVRRYEADRNGLVHNYILQQYLEEAAIQASTDVGFSAEWYDQHGTVWVVREITVDYLHPAGMNDELEIRTWIADFRRVRSHREYEIYRLPEHLLLLRASADWVYIDRNKLWPVRIPAEALARFPVPGHFAVPPARPVPALAADVSERRFVSRRTAQWHEVDSMVHVNNAMYITWFEQALRDTLAAWLPGLDRACRPCWRRHRIEYINAVLPGEEVEITTRLVGMGRARTAWYQDVRRPGSNQPAITDSSIVLYLDEQQRPQPWPTLLAHT